MCGLNFLSPYTSFLVKVLMRMKRHKVHREKGDGNGLQSMNCIVNLKIQAS